MTLGYKTQRCVMQYKLIQVVPTTDDTIYRHPEPTQHEIDEWIDEFCLLCLLVLILIYGILLQYCCQHLSLLPSFYETQSIHVECKQNVVLFEFYVVRLNFGKKILAPAQESPLGHAASIKSVSAKKSRGHRTSKIVKSRQSYSNDHLPYHCSSYYFARAHSCMTWR